MVYVLFSYKTNVTLLYLTILIYSTGKLTIHFLLYNLTDFGPFICVSKLKLSKKIKNELNVNIFDNIKSFQWKKLIVTIFMST